MLCIKLVVELVLFCPNRAGYATILEVTLGAKVKYSNGHRLVNSLVIYPMVSNSCRSLRYFPRILQAGLVAAKFWHIPVPQT